VLPSRLLLLFVVAFPAGVAFYIAFTDWSPTSGLEWFDAYRSWRWLGEYRDVLLNSDFWLALSRTAFVVVVAVGVEAVVGFGLALLLWREFRGRNFLVVFLLLPMMVVPAVSGFIFSMLFQTDGPINAGLTALLRTSVHVHWLDDPRLAIWSVIVVDIWQWTPLMFLIFLSGLVALPEDQLNAARILGASFWYQLRHLIFPMMKPIILVALIIRGIETFKLFDAAWLLTQGGPGNASSTISVFLYRQTFVSTHWGYATAAAIVVLILVSVAAVWASRPIERAQEDNLEKIVRGEEPSQPRAEYDSERGRELTSSARDRAGELRASGDARRFGRVRAQGLRRRLGWVGRSASILLIGAAFSFPIYWVVTMAFKPELEWSPVGSVYWFPAQPTMENFKDILGLVPPSAFFSAGATDASEPIRTSIAASVGGTALALLIGVFASYAIARFRAGGRLLPFQILQLRMFPPVAVIIPLMLMWAYLHLFDTLLGLVIVYAAVTFPFVVWLMRSFFQEVPRELSEAAITEGCTHWGAFFKVVLPQVKAGLATTALFVFILNWSDFLIALVLSQQNVITAPVFLNTMQSVGAGQLYGPQAALALILILPPAIFGMLIQRYLVRGLTFGAIKR
jgi:multiple sugar transport system permease protein